MPNSKLTLRELQQVSLDILKDVHQFCKLHDIRYSLAYGTLLGAVRHQGFIPWDDDIDIFMPRPDYERFLKSYHSSQYKLAYTGKGCPFDCLIAYARVFDDQKTIAKNSHWIAERTGVWIDIFPLDGVPSDKESFSHLYKKLHAEWEQIIPKKIQYTRLMDQPGIKEKYRLFKRKIRMKNGLGAHKMQEQYNEKIQALPFESADFWSQLAVMDNGPVEHMPKETFSDTVLMPFEDSHFCVMNGYKENLKALYGDYMQLPPENERVQHQSYIRFYWRH